MAAEVLTLAVGVHEETWFENKMAQVVTQLWKCLRKTWLENKMKRCRCEDRLYMMAAGMSTHYVM